MAGEAPSTKRRGDNPINTTRKQRALTPRKEPYWHSFRKGASVGLYVGTTRSEWRTRALGPDRKYKFKTLGAIEDLSYDDAVVAAMKFADAASSADRPNYTVRDAIADYTEHLLKTKGPKSADNAAGRLNKHVLPTLGNRTLADLRTQELNRWMRDTIPAAASERDQQRAKSTVNRTYSSFRAALNLAFREGIVSSDTEWRRVKSFPNADAARELFLTQAQVAALLDTSAGCFRDLVRAAVLTGARYGELGSAKVRDLDPQNGTLHLDGKTGPRDCHLGAEALTSARAIQ